jgi:hypothetical protein
VEQDELFRYAVDLLERLAIPYMIVGSVASGIWGEPRMTLDIDIVIQPTADQLEQLCQGFPVENFYVSREAARAALQQAGQFNVIHPESAQKIDFMIAGSDEWAREQLSRRQRIQIAPGREGYYARPEDVILSKMLYYREGGSEKHLRDIAGMFKTSGAAIDHQYIEQWSKRLGVEEIWEAVVKRLTV